MIKKIRRRIAPFLVSWLGFPILRLLMKTCRIEMEGTSYFLDAAREGKLILALWHNRICPIPFFLPHLKEANDFRFAILSSRSRDGDLLAGIIKKYPQAVNIRIPAKGKHLAWKKVLEACEESKTVVMITPDGPRGPAYKAKVGIAHIARTTRSSVVAVSWTSTEFWEYPSWDRMRIPKPFSKIQVKFSPPAQFNDEESSLEEDQKRIELMLHSLDYSTSS